MSNSEWEEIMEDEGYEIADRNLCGNYNKNGDKIMTAQEFADSIEYPCFFYAGVGAPAGQAIAILPETELPVDLEELTGSIEDDGIFECDNLTHGPGVHDWSFSDFDGNLIYKIQVFSSKEIWERESQNGWANEH